MRGPQNTVGQHQLCAASVVDAETEARTIEREPHRLGEGAAAVTEHYDVGGSSRLCPGIHDPGVVHADAHDLADALGLQLGAVLDVAGEVHLRAAGGEGTRHREEDNLAAAEDLGGGNRLRGTLDEDVHLHVRDAVSDLDAHGNSLVWWADRA